MSLQEQQLTSSFLLHHKLHVKMDAVYMAEKDVQLMWIMWPYDKCIIQISEPTSRLEDGYV
jgi:hypothetical protein